MPLGYNPDPTCKRKHYWKYYADELENVEGIFSAPFTNVEIKRGQQRGLQKSWFGKNEKDETGSITSVKNMGNFKGVVTVNNIESEEVFS